MTAFDSTHAERTNAEDTMAGEIAPRASGGHDPAAVWVLVQAWASQVTC